MGRIARPQCDCYDRGTSAQMTRLGMEWIMSSTNGRGNIPWLGRRGGGGGEGGFWKMRVVEKGGGRGRG